MKAVSSLCLNVARGFLTSMGLKGNVSHFKLLVFPVHLKSQKSHYLSLGHYISFICGKKCIKSRSDYKVGLMQTFKGELIRLCTLLEKKNN